MIVMKFGGTSVGSAERLQGVLALVNAAQKKHGGVVVVLSAMSGITNSLISAANKAYERDLKGSLTVLAGIRDTHEQCIETLFTKSPHSMALLKEINAMLDELEILFKGISYLGELTKRSMDAVSGMGELMSSKIFAAYAQSKNMNAEWLDARSVVVTDDNFGQAHPLWDVLIPKAKETITPLLSSGKIVVTQGFIGATSNGARTTLGRGGSDYSGSIFGVALDAEEIQIWTDVDGMMTADPRVVPDAVVLPEVSFQEASELAYFGAKVLHPLTIAPAVDKNIPVRILNTIRPDRPGTIIKASVDAEGLICAIAAKKGIHAFFISSPRMLMTHGFLTRVFEVFDKHQTSIDLISTSEVSVSLTIDRADTIEAIAAELKAYGEVRVLSDVSIVTVVGRQFREKSGIAGQVFDAIRNINIIMISGGASDINLSFVVTNQEADLAMQQLHKTFFTQNLVGSNA